MADRPGLDSARVLEAAGALVDRVGLEGLGLTPLAALLGVRAPSLYHHVAGLDGLRRALGARVASELVAALRGAAEGLAPRPGVRAVARAYRLFALRHPGRVAALRASPEAFAEVTRELEACLERAGATGAPRLFARRLFVSFVEGFSQLEERGALGQGALDESFERGLAVVLAAVPS
jgi:AcrR family transcriptional regulator